MTSFLALRASVCAYLWCLYMLRAPALLQIQRFLPVEQLLAKPLECATSAFEAAPELASDDALN